MNKTLAATLAVALAGASFTVFSGSVDYLDENGVLAGRDQACVLKAIWR